MGSFIVQISSFNLLGCKKYPTFVYNVVNLDGKNKPIYLVKLLSLFYVKIFFNPIEPILVAKDLLYISIYWWKRSYSDIYASKPNNNDCHSDSKTVVL